MRECEPLSTRVCLYTNGISALKKSEGHRLSVKAVDECTVIFEFDSDDVNDDDGGECVGVMTVSTSHNEMSLQCHQLCSVEQREKKGCKVTANESEKKREKKREEIRSRCSLCFMGASDGERERERDAR